MTLLIDEDGDMRELCVIGFLVFAAIMLSMLVQDIGNRLAASDNYTLEYYKGD